MKLFTTVRALPQFDHYLRRRRWPFLAYLLYVSANFSNGKIKTANYTGVNRTSFRETLEILTQFHTSWTLRGCIVRSSINNQQCFYVVVDDERMRDCCCRDQDGNTTTNGNSSMTTSVGTPGAGATGAAAGTKPRSLRFTWSMKTTSSMDPADMMSEIRKILDNNNCDYEQRERFLLLCSYQDSSSGGPAGMESNVIQWEMEVILSLYHHKLLLGNKLSQILFKGHCFSFDRVKILK